MDDAEDQKPDDDDAEHPPPKQDKPVSFGPLLPAGFAQSLLPNFSSLNANINKLVTPLHLGLNFQSSTNALAKRVQAQLADIIRVTNPTRTILDNFESQYRSMFAGLVDSDRILKSLQRAVAPYTKAFAELPRLLLPPNLREVSDDITAADVLDLLDTCSDPITSTEVHFVRDGIGALKAGHHAAAQAIFTVTLDTLISRFYPDKTERKQITNRKKGEPMPDKISDMGVREAYVWLPVWNAHQQYWQNTGDRIPNDYSRHATVHAVSKTQFNKRNCIQSLMLATSLIGYADQLVGAADDSADDE